MKKLILLFVIALLSLGLSSCSRLGYIEVFILTSDSNRGTVVNEKTKHYRIGQEVELVALAKPGFVLIGWDIDDAFISEENNYLYTVEKETTIYAIFGYEPRTLFVYGAKLTLSYENPNNSLFYPSITQARVRIHRQNQELVGGQTCLIDLPYLPDGHLSVYNGLSQDLESNCLSFPFSLPPLFTLDNEITFEVEAGIITRYVSNNQHLSSTSSMTNGTSRVVEETAEASTLEIILIKDSYVELTLSITYEFKKVE